LIFGEKFFPALEAKGDCVGQAFKSSPEGPRETTRLVYLSAIAGARKNIRIAQSYFVPDDLSIQALIDASARGVRVEIITPSHIDAGAVRRASRSLWPQLLRAGVIFYEYAPAMYHCKIMIVDDLFVTAHMVKPVSPDDLPNMRGIDGLKGASPLGLEPKGEGVIEDADLDRVGALPDRGVCLSVDRGGPVQGVREGDEGRQCQKLSTVESQAGLGHCVRLF